MNEFDCEYSDIPNLKRELKVYLHEVPLKDLGSFSYLDASRTSLDPKTFETNCTHAKSDPPPYGANSNTWTLNTNDEPLPCRSRCTPLEPRKTPIEFRSGYFVKEFHVSCMGLHDPH